MPILKTLEKSKYIRLALMARNLKLMVQGKKHRFYYDHEAKLFYIRDNDHIHYFGDLRRGVGLYSNGLSLRAKKLWKSYLLDHITFESDDLIIDCGANYGDLWLGLKGKIPEKNYITFEPGVKEFRSICKNACNATNNNLGLSNTDGRAQFFINSMDADSSIIEPSSYSAIAEIETTTLTTYIEAGPLKKIKLLKLEAEGFEFEILEGAKPILDRIKYIAIDGGYERGKRQEETFSAQTNFLMANGFEIIGINWRWSRALFRRKPA